MLSRSTAVASAVALAAAVAIPSIAHAVVVSSSATGATATAVARSRTNGDTVALTKFSGSGSNVGTYSGTTGEGPASAIDGSLTTKYLTFDGAGLNDDGSANQAKNQTGVLIRLLVPTAIDSFVFGTGNDFPSRDPGAIQIEGTNSTDALPTQDQFSPVYTGGTGIDNTTPRSSFGSTVSLGGLSTPYLQYRVIVTDLVRFPGSAPTNLQFSEIQLSAVPEPASLSLLGLGGLALLRRKR